MTLLIAGKGHEQVQLIGDRREPFDDLQVAGECLEGVDAVLSWCTPSSLLRPCRMPRGRPFPQPGWSGCRAVSIDSRTLRRGDLFVAIRGDRHDGHDHIHEAVARGAGMLLVEHAVQGVRFRPLSSPTRRQPWRHWPEHTVSISAPHR